MERVDYESLIIQDLLNFHSSKSLDINPWYQRRSVWSTPQKAYLINTVFERKPVPSLYIRHQIDIDAEKSIKEVVDGQQRIRSILEYKNDEFPARHPGRKSKVKFSELTKGEKTQFLSTALSVGYLIGAEDRDVIEIFGRINSISKSLNPQEKRNAQYSGEFKQFCLRQAAERVPFWRATELFSANDISRMLEVQFISDLTINLIEGLKDYSATLIDKFYKDNDEDFPQEDDVRKRMENIFSQLAALPAPVIADSVFKASQIAFSLMFVIDKLKKSFSPNRLTSVIEDIDSKVRTFSDPKTKTSIDTRYLAGFTGGNLHRIRSREIRDKILTDALS